MQPFLLVMIVPRKDHAQNIHLLANQYFHGTREMYRKEGVAKRLNPGQKRGDSSLLTWERVGGGALKTNIVMPW